MLRVCVLIVLNDRCSSPAISRCESSLRRSRRTDSSASLRASSAAVASAGSRRRREPGPALGPRAAARPGRRDPHTWPRRSGLPRRSAAPRRGGRAAARISASASSEYAISIDATPRRASSVARRRTCVRCLEIVGSLEQLTAHRQRQRARPVLGKIVLLGQRDRLARRARRRSPHLRARIRSPRDRRWRASRRDGCRWPWRSGPPRSGSGSRPRALHASAATGRAPGTRRAATARRLRPARARARDDPRRPPRPRCRSCSDGSRAGSRSPESSGGSSSATGCPSAACAGGFDPAVHLVELPGVHAEPRLGQAQIRVLGRPSPTGSLSIQLATVS